MEIVNFVNNRQVFSSWSHELDTVNSLVLFPWPRAIFGLLIIIILRKLKKPHEVSNV